MKKILSFVLVLMMGVALSACGSAKKEESKGEKEEVKEITDSKEVVAEQFVDELENNVQNNPQAFADMFVNASDDVIAEQAQGLGNALRTYDKRDVNVIGQNGNAASIEVTYYIVTGSHPDTQRESVWFTYPVSLSKDGKWKIDGSDEAAQASLEIIKSRCPEEVANPSGNCVVFGNKMWMGDGVYEGCSNVEIVYTWEQEDGSVVVGIWMANGSGMNLRYTDATVTLESVEHGTILEANGNVDTAVKDGSSAVVEMVIPAESVLVHEDWGEVNASVNVSF